MIPYLSRCSSSVPQAGGEVHTEQPAGAAAPRDPGRAAVGALPRSSQAGLGPGDDGWVHSGGGGGLLDCGDPLLQPRNELYGDQ